MNEESESKHRYHDGHDRKRHELAASKEKTFLCAICSIERINDRERVDGQVKKKENDKEDAEKLKRIAEAEETARVEKKLNEIKAEIIEFFMNNKTNVDAIKPALEVCKKSGFSNPNEIDDLKVAEKVLAACK